MLEGTEHGKRRKSGTYNAGVKDLASAYVLCPCLAECGVFRFMDGTKVYGVTRGLEAELNAGTETEYLRQVEGQVTGGLI